MPTSSSVSRQIFSTSLREAPGTTNSKVPFFSATGSRRRARRNPSTATMVSPSSSTTKRLPVWTGRLSSSLTANRVCPIMARRVCSGMDREF